MFAAPLPTKWSLVQGAAMTTTAAQVAERLQAQINELLEEVDKSLNEVADLDLDDLCA